MREMAVADVSIEALLGAVHTSVGGGTSGGVTMTSDTGDVLFDVAALYPLLMERYEQYTARAGGGGGGTPGGASELPAAAVKSALRYAQQYNTYTLLRGALSAVAEAWAQAVEVAFTRQYDQLADVLQPLGGTSGTAPAEVLLEVLMTTLESTRRMLSRGGTGGGTGGTSEALALQMAGVARMLLSKLQEQVGQGGARSLLQSVRGEASRSVATVGH